jgi:hypothetical protein
MIGEAMRSCCRRRWSRVGVQPTGIALARYDLAGQTAPPTPGQTPIAIPDSDSAVVALREENALTVAIAGTRFSIKNLNGFTIEFLAGKSGAIEQAAFYQPNGNFVAKRK